MLQKRFLAASLVLICTGAACTSADRTSATADTAVGTRTADGVPYAYERVPLDTTRPPGTIVDSVFPMPEMIRRFRAGLPELRTLVGGAPSRAALVADFVTALSAGDKSALGRMTISRAEFAYLYYPNTRDYTAPNGLTPTLRWDLVTLASEKGIARALERIGGQGALVLERLDCPNPPVTQGRATLHDGCTVRLKQVDGARFNGQLFGSILEYAGQFKFVGYANDM